MLWCVLLYWIGEHNFRYKYSKHILHLSRYIFSFLFLRQVLYTSLHFLQTACPIIQKCAAYILADNFFLFFHFIHYLTTWKRKFKSNYPEMLYMSIILVVYLCVFFFILQNLLLFFLAISVLLTGNYWQQVTKTLKRSKLAKILKSLKSF